MNSNDTNEVNLWKTKRILTILREASGNGTSMVSIILRPGESISKMNQKLTEEYGTAGNIKSRVNRQSVESAIISAQQRLKLYSKCPKNGLAIFSGEVMGADRKEKRLVIDFEPFKPINTTMYMCDNHFHIEPLEALLADDRTFVFIIVDGNGYTLATLTGNTKSILDSEEVCLPSKTRRGGQSSNRYARLRDEAKHEWIKKVSERAKKNLIDNGFITKIEGVILAGNADIKHELHESALLDPRIKEKIMKPLVDVPYGGSQGLNHAIILTHEKLGGIKFVEEKNLLEKYFEGIARDSNVSVGVKDTITALESSAVEYLILWEQLNLEKWIIRNENIGEDEIRYVDPKMVTVASSLKKGEQLIEKSPLLEWFVDTHNQYGAEIRFVSDHTNEGSQFVKGFGGVGALLRYKMDFTDYADDDDDDAYVSEDDIF